MVISKLMDKDEETKFRLGGCKFWHDCDTCIFNVCIMEEGEWTPGDLEKAIKILTAFMPRQPAKQSNR